MLPAKYRIHAVLLLICLLIIFLPLYHQQPNKKEARAASAAIADFFRLVDADHFAASWQQAAATLKEKITQSQWVEQLEKTRAVTGPLLHRRQEKLIFSKVADDSPEGKYILVIFNSDFQKRTGVKERVTVMLDSDSHWRVAGYFLQ